MSKNITLSRKTVFKTAKKLFKGTQAAVSTFWAISIQLNPSFLLFLYLLQTFTYKAFNCLFYTFTSFRACLEVSYS
jgi:hypothetical protein